MANAEKKLINVDQMKQMQTEILYKFHQFCHENDLHYYLYGGTLLGSVRHKGFIPWDDDIDLAIPRPDYERLVALLKTKKISPHLDFINHENNKYYPYPFGKLYDNRTVCDIPGLDGRMEIGVWIDLFPMDGLPGDKQERDAHIDALQKDIKILNRATRKFFFTKDLKRLARNIGVWALYSHYNHKKLIEKLDRVAREYDFKTSPYIGVVSFCRGQNNVIEKAGFEDIISLPFEQYEFDAPGTYVQYLTNIYGADCFELPPESERLKAHDFTVRWKEGVNRHEIY